VGFFQLYSVVFCRRTSQALCYFFKLSRNMPGFVLILFMQKIGFGGSCHWCTEAIFQSIIGVSKVDQGWIASTGEAASYSEAVMIVFDPDLIAFQTLIEIHLRSHSCTANHSLRGKYRSAVYIFNDEQADQATRAIALLQDEFDEPIITTILPFAAFKLNEENYLNYYYRNPQKPFCENIVSPKLNDLRQRFGASMTNQSFNSIQTGA
jgi:peptide-methionine (S)-S-oxide reductase